MIVLNFTSDPDMTLRSFFQMVTFPTYRFQTIYPSFPLFRVNQKGVFSHFLQIWKNYKFGHEIHSQLIQKSA